MNEYVQPFCAGQTFLPDGRLLVAGGHDKWDGYGAIQTTIFDPKTNKWSKSADMNAGRWYPTHVAAREWRRPGGLRRHAASGQERGE